MLKLKENKKFFIPIWITFAIILMNSLINLKITNGTSIKSQENIAQNSKENKIKYYIDNLGYLSSKQSSEFSKLGQFEIISNISQFSTTSYQDFVDQIKKSSTNELNHSNIITTVIDSQTTYLRISSIYHGEYHLVMQGLEKLADKKGLHTLYLDLRNLKTAFWDDVIKITNQLVTFEHSKLITINYFNGNKIDLQSKGNTFFPTKNLYVLVDTNTCVEGVAMAGMLKSGSSATLLGQLNHPQPWLSNLFRIDQELIKIPVGYFSFNGMNPNPLDIERNFSEYVAPDRDLNSNELQKFTLN